MSIAQLHETPAWVNLTIILGGSVLSWIQPIAGVVAIVWGLLQIYSWFVNKGWRKK